MHPELTELPTGPVAPNTRLVRVIGRRVVIAGRIPLDAEGYLTGPHGRVGHTVFLEQAKTSSEAIICAILANLRHEVGDLAQVGAWIKLDGWVDAAPGFVDLAAIMNPASELIFDICGTEVGAHARYVIGFTGPRFGAPVELAAEVKLLR